MRPTIVIAFVFLICAFVPGRARAGIFTVEFQDVTLANGVGFDDPTAVPASPCGTTLGQLRRCTALRALDDLGTLITFANGAAPKIRFIPSATTGSSAPGAASDFYNSVLGNPQGGYLYSYITTGTDPNLAGPELNIHMNFAPSVVNGAVSTMNSDYTVIDETRLDLYTIVLHEAMHGLGIASLVGSTGKSTISGTLSGPYARFDQFLVPAGTATPIVAAGANPAFTGPLAALTGNLVEYYESGNAIARLPVVSPGAFVAGSSLSHFDRTRAPANGAGTPYPNLMIPYVMGSGLPLRAVAPEEQDVLCDLGYNLGTVCTDRFPVGVDDLAPSTPQGTPVCLNVLANDVDQDFDALQIDPVHGVQILNGNGSDASISFLGPNVCYTPPASYVGTAALEYYPTDGTRVGTKAIVRIPVTGEACSSDLCNLVCNAGYEDGVSTSTFIGFDAMKTCPSMVDNWCAYGGSPDYCVRGSSNPVPNAAYAPGCPGGIDTWDAPNSANNRFLSFLWYNFNSISLESTYAPLLHPLVPGKTYELTYHAIASIGYPGKVSVGFINTLSSVGFDLTIPDAIVNTCNDGGWSTVTASFVAPTGSSLSYIVIGSSGNTPATANSSSPSLSQRIFVDDVRLIDADAYASVSIVVDSPTPHIGQLIEYTMSICNNGPTPKTIHVEDYLPAGVDFVAGNFSYPSESFTIGPFACEPRAIIARVSSTAAIGVPLSNCVGVGDAPNCGSVRGPSCADITVPSDISVCGRVWYDEDRDGIRSGGENGLSGQIVNLTKPNGTVLAQVTGPGGTFCFTGLTAGAHLLQHAPQSGWVRTFPPTVDHNLSLVPGMALQDVEFGEAPVTDCTAAPSWQALGAGTNAGVLAMAEIDVSTATDVYVGGQFTTVGGISANHIARWSGGWTTLGSGVNGTVFAIAQYGTDIYVAGSFTQAGGVAAKNIARWNGGSWFAVGAGTDDEILAMKVYKDVGRPAELYVAGIFANAGGQPANKIARWNGASWSAVGTGITGSQVNALTTFDDGGGQALIAGGLFTQAGSVAVNGVARFRSGAWSAMGSLAGGPFAFALHDAGTGAGTELYSAGTFTGGVARWNGTAWSTVGTGFANPVFALTSFKADGVKKLFAGGFFNQVGSIAATNIASWNGSKWASVAGGVNSQVNSLLATTGWLYVGGFFDHATALPASDIARWGCPTGGGGNPAGFAEMPIPLKRPRLALAALPNPARGSQTLQLVLPQSADVDMRLYDAAGRLVRVLANGRYLAGLHAIPWDGTDEHGEPVRVGMYLLRVESEGTVRSLKLVRLP
jgi:uncharacterized repeat protein (TIGR01451 family)